MAEEMDPSTCLARLVESKRRQEQLMEKVCALLVSVEAKVGRVAAQQEKMEALVQSGGGGRGLPHGPVGDVSNIMNMMGSSSFVQAQDGAARGKFVKPIGQKADSGYPQQQPVMPVQQFIEPDRSIQYDHQLQAEADRVAHERKQMKVREEEIARRQEEEEERRRVEAEHRRVEAERLAEEERKRKAALGARTQGMMSGLLEGGGSDLFGDAPAPKAKKAGGLFDDDD